MSETKSHPQLGTLTKHRCPRCGNPLYYYDGFVWCSHVVAASKSGSCDFGVARDVTLDEYEAMLRNPKHPVPQEAGFYIFDGIRRTGSGRMVTIYDLVETKRKIIGKEIVFLVYNMDTQRSYPISMYEGVWTRVLIPFEKKRTS